MGRHILRRSGGGGKARAMVGGRQVMSRSQGCKAGKVGNTSVSGELVPRAKGWGLNVTGDNGKAGSVS